METESVREIGRKIRAFFDRHAPNWENMVLPECTARVKEILDELDIAPGDSILDVGAGTGVLFELLAPRLGDSGQIIAIDVSGEMLRLAKAKGHGMKVACIQADVLTLPIRLPVFDWVICYSVFPHFSNQLEGLRELVRVLKPQGRLVVCHSKSREDINALHESVGDVVGGHCIPEDLEMKALIRQAGLMLERFESKEDRYVVVARHT